MLYRYLQNPTNLNAVVVVAAAAAVVVAVVDVVHNRPSRGPTDLFWF